MFWRRNAVSPRHRLRSAEGWPEPGPYYGRDAVMRDLEQLRETWDADVLEVIGDFIDVADHIVLRFVWRGKGGGPETNFGDDVCLQRFARAISLHVHIAAAQVRRP